MASVNGTELYYERVGAGPAALFIAGSTGDAGTFTRTAERLADEFTVVCYDRRGNSRSPRPQGWRATSVSEQADDAAGLIRELGIAPACVFAASAGGLIGLDLAMRHSELVRGAVLQEPSLFCLLPDAKARLAARRKLVQETLPAKGPQATVRALLQHLNTADVFEAIPADVLQRMEENGDTIFRFENAFAAWRPDEAALAAIRLPLVLMVAQDTRPEYVELIKVLEARLGQRAVTVPGPHGFYLYRPDVLAEAVRPHFRAFVARGRSGVC